MGRKPTPTHLKLVKGITRKDRLNQSEPKPPPGIPEPPDHLSGKNSRRAWIEFAVILQRMGVLTTADRDALGRMCDIYAEIQDLKRAIENHGHVYESGGEVDKKTGQVIRGTGLIKARPEVGMLADSDRRFRQYLTDFGLTPSARSKLTVGGGKEDATPESRYFG